MVLPHEMEWSTTSISRNGRRPLMPPPRLESNWLSIFDSEPYAGNPNTHTARHSGPTVTIPESIVTVPESEKINKTYQRSSSNNEIVKKKKTLTSEQLASLEQSFREDMKLDLDRKLLIAKELGLQLRQVSVWFQNRRARWKVKHLEESYELLRQEYDALWREKQMLHDEVKKLRDIIRNHHQGFMKTQSSPYGHQMSGIGEYTSPMMIAPSGWPPAVGIVAADLGERESNIYRPFDLDF